MTKVDHEKEKYMWYICIGIPKAASGFALAWPNLLKAEFIAKQNFATGSDAPTNVIIPLSPDRDPTKTSNISEVIRLQETSLKMLGMVLVQCVQKCHLKLKYKLVPAAKELANRKQPITNFMFRDNIEEHYKSILEVN